MKQNSAAFLVGGLLAAGMSGLAKAGQLEDGEAAYFNHDYAKAVRLLRPLADKENAPAQNRRASIYFWGGHGAPQDPAQAAFWYRKAGTKGTHWRRLILA
jgi:uncharacterized protein